MSHPVLLSLEVEIPTEDGGTEKKAIQYKPLTQVPIGIVRRTRHDNDEQMWAIFEWAFSAEDLATFDLLPAAKLLSLLEEMQQASRVDLGESQASPTS